MKKILFIAFLSLFLSANDEFREIKSAFFEGKAFLKVLQIDENLSSGVVKFEKGARTFWHTHPKGQTLVVLDGVGFTQEFGKEKRVIKKGDVIVCPAGVKHWHGASENSTLTHLALAFKDENNKSVNWLERVEE